MRPLLPLGVACLGLTVIQFGGSAVEYLGGRRRLHDLCECAGFFALVGAVAAQFKVAATDWQTAQASAVQKVVLTAVLVLFGASCLTPAVYVDDGGKPASDLDFRIGSPIGLALLWMGTTSGWSPWVANLLFLPAISWLAGRRFLAASLLGAVASLVALLSWRLEMTWLLGCHLWQSSFLALAVGAALAAGVSAR